MHLSHILDDGIVKLVPRNLNRSACDNTAKRNYRNVSSSAADIDDHHAVGLRNINACANGSRNRLFHQIHILAACLGSRLSDGSLLDLCYAARHADHDFRLEKSTAAAGLFNKVFQHSFGDIVIGDYAVAQRSYRNDISRRSSKHLSCLFTHCQNIVCILINCHNRRLIEHDSFIFYIY